MTPTNSPQKLIDSLVILGGFFKVNPFPVDDLGSLLTSCYNARLEKHLGFGGIWTPKTYQSNTFHLRRYDWKPRVHETVSLPGDFCRSFLRISMDHWPSTRAVAAAVSARRATSWGWVEMGGLKIIGGWAPTWSIAESSQLVSDS